jgi:hypothetical protein
LSHYKDSMKKLFGDKRSHLLILIILAVLLVGIITSISNYNSNEIMRVKKFRKSKNNNIISISIYNTVF